MYCDYCGGSGQIYCRRQGRSLNDPPYVQCCAYCKGTGVETNESKYARRARVDGQEEADRWYGETDDG
jgi:hypothetical protein